MSSRIQAADEGAGIAPRESAAASSSQKGSGLLNVFRNRNFRLLWMGEGISLLGDQFYLIALPWLVLKLTGSPLAIGTVLALAAIPRALFMLVGGALTDRFSPRALMLCSNLGRFALVASLAALTVTGQVQLWMLYAFALLFGLANAFFFPAQSAIIPKLLGSERLQTGNAIVQGTAQLSVFLGPVLAGTLIAVLDGGGSAGAIPDMVGIGTAFAVDAVTFLASAGTLALMRLSNRTASSQAEPGRETVWASILAGLKLVWEDKALRYYFVLIAAVNLLMTGPISVGIPVLADTRFHGGAVAFGIILSGFGGGSLLGIVVAGVSSRPSNRRFPLLMLGLTATMGVTLALLGVLPSVASSTFVAFIMGCAQGYVVIQFITWLQLRTPSRMLGRMMSVLMFAVVGLAPLSSAVAGALIQWSATFVMVGGGLLIVLVVAIAAVSPSVWRLGDEDASPATHPAAPAHRPGERPVAVGRTAALEHSTSSEVLAA
jgi:MFS family permease